MPTYTFRNKESQEVEDRIMSIASMEELLAEGEWEQIHQSAPMTVTHVGSMLGKTSGDWKDLIKKVKKGSGKGNSINA